MNLLLKLSSDALKKIRRMATNSKPQTFKRFYFFGAECVRMDENLLSEKIIAELDGLSARLKSAAAQLKMLEGDDPR